MIDEYLKGYPVACCHSRADGNPVQDDFFI